MGCFSAVFGWGRLRVSFLWLRCRFLGFVFGGFDLLVVVV